MIGIPIMLVCVAFIGEVMADVFRFVYVQLCCCGLCARRARLRRHEREVAERRRRELEAREANRRIPPSWNQLYQEQMRLNHGQPVVVDDHDDNLFDEEVLQYTCRTSSRKRLYHTDWECSRFWSETIDN